MKISRFAAAVVSALLVLALAGCNQAASPRDAVDRFASAMNQNNFRQAFAYIADYDSFGFSDRTEEIMKVVASSMRIEYVSESSGTTSATVDVKITTVDLRQIYMSAAAEVIPDYYQAAVSGKNISESEIGDRLIDKVIDLAGRSTAPTVTTPLSLYLVSNSGKWEIKLDTPAYYAITGYLEEANNLVTTGLIVNAISGPEPTQPTAPPAPVVVSPTDAEETEDTVIEP